MQKLPEDWQNTLQTLHHRQNHLKDNRKWQSIFQIHPQTDKP